MSTIYLNCENGVSGDMVLNALIGLTDDPETVRAEIGRISHEIDHLTHGHSHSHDHNDDDNHTHEHVHDHDHSHEEDMGHFHRSYSSVLAIIASVSVSDRVKETARSIYAVIAKAESTVHESPLDDLHFHEVGRDQAIANVLGVSACLDVLDVERVFVSDICDGHGTVKCAHGVLNVPVPAVKAMLDDNAVKITYRQTEHEGEMVTPSGLAMILGIGAITKSRPEGNPKKTSEARGARSFTEHGLIAELFDA